ncbi:MAG: ABC transporter substrate-binding protein [Gammaproteobacteria bacterium]
MKIKVVSVLFVLFFAGSVLSADKNLIRVGVLAFGTANWELAALQNEGLDDPGRYRLDVRSVANPQAGKIALQSGAVDVIVSDWIWVSAQRSSGTDFTFYPYSETAGALIVPADSPVRGVKDLINLRLGIAGGELDKNWLLLRALAKRQYGLDLDRNVEKVYGAPPLLNQQMLHGNLDALINYWHYAARLEAQGYRALINGREIQEGLGIKPIPMLGYVFRESWAKEHRKALSAFLAAAKQAKELLCTSDAAWEKIAPPPKSDRPETAQILRLRYCEGRVADWGEEEQQAAGDIFRLLKEFGGGRLTGSSDTLQPGTFWTAE